MSQTKKFVDIIELNLSTADLFPENQSQDASYYVENKRFCVFDMFGTTLSHIRQLKPGCWDYIWRA